MWKSALVLRLSAAPVAAESWGNDGVQEGRVTLTLISFVTLKG